MQTHSDKLKIIPIRRHRTETKEIDDEELDKYETQGTVVGLDINTHGVTQQIKKTQSYGPSSSKQTIQIQRL